MPRLATDINLLNPNEYRWNLSRPVTTGDTFEGQTINLNEEGLFSTTIFGRQGTADRDNTPSYVDIGLSVFNPLYFNAMVSLKGIYAEIIKGSTYAIWSESEKDFIKSNVIEGETGFSFFVKHLGELEPKQTESNRRKKKIQFFENRRDIALTNKIIIIPAGIRDIDFLPNGTASEPEINKLYKKLIFRSRSLFGDRIDPEDPLYDNIRWGLQEGFNNIDNFLFTMMKGKSGFFQRKVIRRAIFNATRNVITARKTSIEDCDDAVTIDPNSTLIGVYQSLLAFTPINVHSLNKGILSRIFTPGVDIANMVNPKTLEESYVEIDSRTVEKWTSYDGLVKLFSGYGNPHFRNKPIMIKGNYLCLTYDDGKHVGLYQGKSSLPEELDPKYLHPTTYTELFYLECSPLIEKKLLQVTRYPIEGLGSIYPCKPIIKPFNDGNGKRIRRDGGELDDHVYNFFPVRNTLPSYFDGMSISNCKISRLGADFDGDAMSANSLMADDTIAECYKLFGKRDYYISGSNSLLYDVVQEPHLYLLRALTIA